LFVLFVDVGVHSFGVFNSAPNRGLCMVYPGDFLFCCSSIEKAARRALA